MFKKIDVIKILSLIMWSIAIFAYFFQFPFKSISSLIIPCLGVFLLCKANKLRFDKKALFLLIVLLIHLTISVAIAITTETGLGRIIRFLFIIVAILFCSFIREEEFKKEIDVFVWLAVAKSLLIIAIAVTIVVVGEYAFLRNWALNNGLGDIYFLSRLAPKVQVQGNALLLVAFILEYLRQHKITKKGIIILLGIIFAGNFAYILGLGLFAVYLMAQKIVPIIAKDKKYVRGISVLVVLAYIVVMPYLIGKIEEKSEVSNQTRVEQAEVLLDANLITGDGLGNYIEASTPTREYDGDIYFELQTLYILNQIGIVGLALFYVILFINVKECGKEAVIVYLIYLVYTFWNPYCFDTTQMITTILIINMSGIGAKNEESNSNCLLSR